MYGRIVQLIALEDKREELAATLLEGAAGMPGCRTYVVAKDAGDVNAMWITEVWDSKSNHDSSLLLQSVQDAIARGRPLIASFRNSVVTTPSAGTA